MKKGSFGAKGGIFYIPSQDEISEWISSEDYIVLVIKSESGMIIGYSSAIISPNAIRDEFLELARFFPSELQSTALWRDSIIHPVFQRQGLAKIIECEILRRLFELGKTIAIGEIYSIENIKFPDSSFSSNLEPNVPAIEARRKFQPQTLGFIQKEIILEEVRIKILSKILSFNLECVVSYTDKVTTFLSLKGFLPTN